MYDPEKYALATIVERRDLAPDLWIVRIQPQQELSFRSGQYVTVGLAPDGGRVVERPYSIASSPTEGTLELFIERVPQGELTEQLYTLAIGTEVAVRKRCKGLFLKDAPLTAQPHLFVATVTGIAPFVSAVRTWAGDDVDKSGDFAVTLLQGASRSEELGYEHEMRDFAAQHQWFTYVPTISRPWEDSEWTGETGRVEDVLRKYADIAGLKPGHGGVYLCGHPQMISNARAIMRRRGLDDKAIREEQYWPE